MTLSSLSAHPEPPRLPPPPGPGDQASLPTFAVRGADWQPDVGGDDHGEGWRAVPDGEAAVGRRPLALGQGHQNLWVDWASWHQSQDIAAASHGTAAGRVSPEERVLLYCQKPHLKELGQGIPVARRTTHAKPLSGHRENHTPCFKNVSLL